MTSEDIARDRRAHNFYDVTTNRLQSLSHHDLTRHQPITESRGYFDIHS